jgi:hypothetical protein
VLSQIMRKLERLGVKDSVVGLVIPTGYSFNLDAFSIYLTLAVVFIAQATNAPLSFGDLIGTRSLRFAGGAVDLSQPHEDGPSLRKFLAFGIDREQRTARFFDLFG